MSRTFLFMPESAYGPTNNCIGIGNVLRQRGHRVVFAAEASWAGKLEALGFEEDLVDLAPPPEPGAGEQTPASVLAGRPEFSTFYALAQTAGLTETLAGAEPLTLDVAVGSRRGLPAAGLAGHPERGARERRPSATA